MKAVRRNLFSALLLLALLAGMAPPSAGGEEAPVTILFTHDTHSHFELANDGEGAYGGFTRLATLLEEERAQAPGPCVTLDGGDFSMGSLLQTIYTTHAAELRTLGALGYDAVTFGNHEYDYRGAGLAEMLNAAVDSGDPLPAIVQANYYPPAQGSEGYDSAAQAVWEALDRAGVADYVVIERDGVRFAVFGVMGEDSDACAPMSGMVYEDLIESARRVVAEIQAREEYDYLIALSHSGTTGGQGEDYELAQAVEGIDVIISGHTHTALEEPIQVNGTLIVSCGEYTKNLGVLQLRRGSGGQVELVDYRLVPVTPSVAEDPALAARTEDYKALVEEEYLSQFGYAYDQVLATSSFSFTPIGSFGQTQGDDALGSLIADSYVYAVEQAEGEEYIPVDFAVVASGVIRGSFSAGDITVSDAFNVSSLGSGADGSPGYPLISAYLYGRELKDAFEVDASVTPLMPAAQLYGSGMSWTYNTNRMIFNKVTDCWQVLSDGSTAPIEDDKLYRVVTGLYSGQMLGTVNSQSFGLLTITPRDANGDPIQDLEAHIIHNASGAEVKEWYALASYLESLGELPQSYAASQERKVVYSSWNPVELLKHPNWITLAALALLLVLGAAVVLVILRLVRRRGRRGRSRGTRGGYRPYRG